MIRITNTLIVLAFLCTATFLSAQTNISGTLRDAGTLNILEGVIVTTEGGAQAVVTDVEGDFLLKEIIGDKATVLFMLRDEVLFEQVIELNGDVVEMGIVKLENTEAIFKTDDIPTVSLGDLELEADNDDGQDISGLLSASRDRFLNTTAFNFGAVRFRIRGYDNQNSSIFVNGAPLNDLENGRAFFGQIGGLNDVMRNQEISLGVTDLSFGYGEVAGSVNIDTRASRQRKQVRASYAVSNRTYANRVMLTYNTGLLKNGWAFSFSGSKRWAEEGYLPASSYDAYSYFASIDKKYGKHLTNFTFYGAPNKRGRAGTAVQELKDLADDNYYNPYWGLQNGEKRNSRIGNSHQPTASLNHEWTISDKSTLKGVVSYRFGRNGSTALNWFNAGDPRPDYYQKLPSFIEDPERAALVANTLSSNEALRQLDWTSFYNANRNNTFDEYEEFLLGTDLEGETGSWSNYIIEDRRYDSKVANVNIVSTNIINDNLTITGGVQYTHYTQKAYKTIEDLLGGDFWIDINRFAITDGIETAAQFNLDEPNKIIREGDTFEYSYDANIRKGLGWIQGSFSTRKMDFFLGGNISHTSFWRTGNFRNGFFPETSFGDSEKQNFTNYNVKGGATYKIDGRNYLYVSGSYGTRAPFFRNSFVAPRKRNDIVPNIKSETIHSLEGGYVMKSPNLKARVSGYWTEFKDQTKILVFFAEFLRDREDFGSFITTDIDQRHVGLELAVEGKVAPGLELFGVASVGQAYYTSRPAAFVSLDEAAGFVVEGETIYQKNYYVSGTPQTALAVGLSYNSSKFWFANLSLNYFDNAWLEFNPLRRTARAIDGIEKDSESWGTIIDQERLPSAFTLDFFGGKSWKIKDKFLYLNIGVNNILNNQEIITGGFEQLRFDFETRNPDRFPQRYYFSFGMNYFASLTLRI